jgi:hypothetical protein
MLPGRSVDSERSEVDFRALKARYHAAFDAYHEIMKRNAEQALAGELPHPEEVEREEKALSVLSEARRELFAALRLELP